MMKKIIVSCVFAFMVKMVFANVPCVHSDNIAIYDINSYTCNADEFLPANTLGCTACPSGATCSGGTFTFNTDEYQGLVFGTRIQNTTINNSCANNFPQVLNAYYEPNQHTCNPGYYLPANTDGCTICPANSYCPGGTYTFNETVSQGINSCGSGLLAPAGMWESTQCGRALHIGDDVVYLHSVKKTTHELHVQIGDNVYYGNITTVDTPMNSGTNRKLKLFFNNQTYCVYDDTINPVE